MPEGKFGFTMKTNYLVCLLSVACFDVIAGFITDSPLSFGEIAIRSNSIVSSTTITRFGNQSSTNQILIIRPGSPGIYTMDGLPLFTTVNLSVDLPAFSAMPYPGTAQFRISAVDLPSSLNSGNNGVVQFRMGATLNTSGNNAENYISGADYVIYLNLNVDF